LYTFETGDPVIFTPNQNQKIQAVCPLEGSANSDKGSITLSNSQLGITNPNVIISMDDIQSNFEEGDPDFNRLTGQIIAYPGEIPTSKITLRDVIGIPADSPASIDVPIQTGGTYTLPGKIELQEDTFYFVPDQTPLPNDIKVGRLWGLPMTVDIVLGSSNPTKNIGIVDVKTLPTLGDSNLPEDAPQGQLEGEIGSPASGSITIPNNIINSEATGYVTYPSINNGEECKIDGYFTGGEPYYANHYGVTSETQYVKFGKKSNRLNWSFERTEYLKQPITLDMATFNGTLETWLRRGDYAGNIFNDKLSYENGSPELRFGQGDYLALYDTVNGIMYTSNIVSQALEWNHIAMVMEENEIRVYQNGQLSLTVDRNLFSKEPIADPELRTGTGTQGSFDDIRISNTSRYTSNFTPPSSSFYKDADTLTIINFEDEAVFTPAENQIISANCPLAADPESSQGVITLEPNIPEIVNYTNPTLDDARSNFTSNIPILDPNSDVTVYILEDNEYNPQIERELVQASLPDTERPFTQGNLFIGGQFRLYAYGFKDTQGNNFDSGVCSFEVVKNAQIANNPNSPFIFAADGEEEVLSSFFNPNSGTLNQSRTRIQGTMTNGVCVARNIYVSNNANPEAELKVRVVVD